MKPSHPAPHPSLTPKHPQEPAVPQGPTAKLSAEERRAHLLASDQQVRAGLRRTGQGLLAAGRGLREIRDRELYRASHRGFGPYALECYGLSRSRAYQLIDFAHVVQNLSTLVDTSVQVIPERVARFLAGYAREAQVAIYQHVLKLGHVDLAGVRAASEGYMPQRKLQILPPGSQPPAAPAPQTDPSPADPGEEATAVAVTKELSQSAAGEKPTLSAATHLSEAEFWDGIQGVLKHSIRSRNHQRTYMKRWGPHQWRFCLRMLTMLESEALGHSHQRRQMRLPG